MSLAVVRGCFSDVSSLSFAIVISQNMVLLLSPIVTVSLDGKSVFDLTASLFL